MYNRKNVSGDAAAEITCSGTCECTTCPCVCPKNVRRCRVSNRHTDADWPEVQ